jgi:probable HAF family extracellular repeat protein
MMRLFTRTTCTGVLASLACLSAQASGIYSLTPILDEPTSVTVGELNDQGEVAGTYDTQTGPHAFTWKDGQFTDVSATIDPATPFTEADGINNQGDLTGTYLSTSFQGYLLKDGLRTDLHVLADESAVFAWRVNDVDQVIGTAYDAGYNEHAYLWDNGQVSLLNPLPGDTRTTVNNLNDGGIVVGESDSETGRRQAVLWRHGKPVNLGALPGTTESIAYDINKRNHVVGLSFTYGTHTAFLWRDGSMTALPGLASSADWSSAASINDWDVVVGRTGNQDSIATVWVKGKAVDLNRLVRSDDPLKPYVTLSDAVLINNVGDIVARGRDSRNPNFLIPYFLTRAH